MSDGSQHYGEAVDCPPLDLDVVAKQLTEKFEHRGVDTTAARLLLQQLLENMQVFPEDIAHQEERWYHGEFQTDESKPPRIIFLVEHPEDMFGIRFNMKVFRSSELPPPPQELADESVRKALRHKLLPSTSRNVARSLIAATYKLPVRRQLIHVRPDPRYL